MWLQSSQMSNLCEDGVMMEMFYILSASPSVFGYDIASEFCKMSAVGKNNPKN